MLRIAISIQHLQYAFKITHWKVRHISVSTVFIVEMCYLIFIHGETFILNRWLVAYLYYAVNELKCGWVKLSRSMQELTKFHMNRVCLCPVCHHSLYILKVYQLKSVGNRWVCVKIIVCKFDTKIQWNLEKLGNFNIYVWYWLEQHLS